MTIDEYARALVRIAWSVGNIGGPEPDDAHVDAIIASVPRPDVQTQIDEAVADCEQRCATQLADYISRAADDERVRIDAAVAKAMMKDRAFTDAEWATRYGAMCRERDRALTERVALCEKHLADENWRDLKDCLACAVEELEERILSLDAEADAAVATAQEQLDAREKSSRNLAHYASHDEGFDAPMSENDLVTRDALRILRQAMEIAIAERAKAQQAMIYLAREAGGSPVATIELDRHGQEIRAALVKLREHAERIARLTGFVSMRLGAECAGYDCVDTAIRFMEAALDAKEDVDAAVAREREKWMADRQRLKGALARPCISCGYKSKQIVSARSGAKEE